MSQTQSQTKTKSQSNAGKMNHQSAANAANHSNSSGTNGMGEKFSSGFVQQKVSEMIQKTGEEFNQVQQKLQEYDEKYQASATAKKTTERASSFLRTTLDETKVQLDTLKQNTKTLFDNSAEVPMKGISRSLAALSAKLEELKELAKQYDDKYKITESVSEIVNPARERAAKYLAEIASYVTELSKATYAQLRGVNDGLAAKFRELTGTGVGFLINTAANLDNKFDIEQKIKSFDEKYKVTKSVKELDEKYRIQENAEGLLEKAREKGKQLDVKFTDGKAGAYIEEAYTSGLKMVTEGLKKVQHDFESAKKNSRENLAAEDK